MKRATFTIGSTVVVVEQGESADLLRNLITRIVRSGEIGWVPLDGLVDGEKLTTAVLVGPSTPINIVYSPPADTDSLMRYLVDRYLAEEVEEGRAKLAESGSENQDAPSV